MSRSFRYWTRCALVLSLTLLVTFNPAWAGRGLRGWLKKRHACCEVVACCSPITTCVPVQPTCCPEVIGECPLPVASSCDCSENDSSKWSQSEGVVIAPSATHSDPVVSPTPAPNVTPVLPPAVTPVPAEPAAPDEPAAPAVPSEVSPSDTQEPQPLDEGAVTEPDVQDSAPEVAEPQESAPIESETPSVESEAPLDTPTIEPEVPATEDVFGNEAPTLPNDQQPTDDELFGEPRTTEPEATEPDSRTPSELFDTPADPIPSTDDAFDSVPTEPMEESLPQSSNDADELLESSSNSSTAPADLAETPNDLFESTTEPSGTEPSSTEPPTTDSTDLFGESSQPAPTESAETEPSISSEDDLFGSSDTPQTESNSEENLFGQSTPPAEEKSETDLFGQPATPGAEPTQPSQSIDSQTPNSDNAVETPDIPSVDSEEDLFGTPSNSDKKEESKDEEEVDLFGLDSERTWRDNTGSFEVEATLAEIQADHVRLLKSNGNYCKVPLRRLSSADRALVELIVSTLPPGGKKLVSTSSHGN